jgi:predicted AlkP superfamily phosphohydrolase/phosphomutase
MNPSRDRCAGDPRAPLSSIAATKNAGMDAGVAGLEAHSTKAVVFATLLLLASCGHGGSGTHGKRVIVLGVDGMDPGFVEAHWSQLPNLARLGDLGGLTRLATTTPPQSPVAWSTFITGLDPAQHGVFDFVHRDPGTMLPFSSMAETLPPRRQLEIGPWALPLSGARVRSLRAGRSFWEILADHGIPVTVMRMPVNYPTVKGVGRELSGLGTPDLNGTFGTFTYYTDDPLEQARDVSGGRIVPVAAANHRVILPIEGPPNTLRRDRRPVRLEVAADIDPGAGVMRIQAGGQQLLLKQGEWSPWIRVRFPLIPHLASVAGMFRLYAQELAPGIRIYRSPLNADPADSALPISTPQGFSGELAGRIGPFYTQGIEEDTSALRQGALSLAEYLEQSRIAMREHEASLLDCLSRFEDGLLFFYFSEIDQNSHVLWGRHPMELLETYQAVDRAIGRVLAEAHDQTVIVMSDHGFAAFDRAVNLNTWLRNEGFLTFDDPKISAGGEMFAHVDWKRTRAYAIGLNALYLNQAGREKNGIVLPNERAAALADLIRRLREFRDADTGRLVVADVATVGPSAGGVSRYAPDLIVGYAPGYRASWETALGAAPAGVVRINDDAWIADHCIAAGAVPGVLLGNRRPKVADPRLKDLTVTILREFGVGPGEGMTGRPIY